MIMMIMIITINIILILRGGILQSSPFTRWPGKVEDNPFPFRTVSPSTFWISYDLASDARKGKRGGILLSKGDFPDS